MKTRELVLRQGSRTFLILTRKLSVQGKRYAKLKNECEEASTEPVKTARKKPNKTKNSGQSNLVEKSSHKTASVMVNEDEGADIVDVAVDIQGWAKKRRYAICDEIERSTYNQNGTSLRSFRKVLVKQYLLKDLRLI